MILLLALWLGCLLNSRSRRCVVMTYVDGWHGAVEWHMYEIKRALESERPTGQLARLFRTRHAYLYLPGLSRINDTSSFTWVAASEE